ncbi:MAG: DUF4349 domain-containing protein [Cyclobacteriaceae bacterium]|nr:DUF4349 domain-containing protein [Cyclobacteriaceae bacterium]
MKRQLIRFVLFVLVGFVALFIFRLVYGYSEVSDRVIQNGNYAEAFSQELSSKKNYASDRYKFQKEEPAENGVNEISIDQKYEKTATVKSKSTDFENDNQLLRNTIKKYNAIIQFEQSSGNKGARVLDLLLGVPPAQFDSIYQALIKIGKVSVKEITKVDKTSEFKNLNAKKASLEITRQSLLEVKKQSGRIDEYINLQNRILEIEQELQGLGVLLGDFSEENEFCTVRFSLSESYQVSISTIHRIKVALEWSIQYYLMFLAIIAFATMFGFFILLIINKTLPSILSKVNQ